MKRILNYGGTYMNLLTVIAVSGWTLVLVWSIVGMIKTRINDRQCAKMDKKYRAIKRRYDT